MIKYKPILNSNIKYPEFSDEINIEFLKFNNIPPLKKLKFKILEYNRYLNLKFKTRSVKFLIYSLMKDIVNDSFKNGNQTYIKDLILKYKMFLKVSLIKININSKKELKFLGKCYNKQNYYFILLFFSLSNYYYNILRSKKIVVYSIFLLNLLLKNLGLTVYTLVINSFEDMKQKNFETFLNLSVYQFFEISKKNKKYFLLKKQQKIQKKIKGKNFDEIKASDTLEMEDNILNSNTEEFYLEWDSSESDIEKYENLNYTKNIDYSSILNEDIYEEYYTFEDTQSPESDIISKHISPVSKSRRYSEEVEEYVSQSEVDDQEIFELKDDSLNKEDDIDDIDDKIHEDEDLENKQKILSIFKDSNILPNINKKEKKLKIKKKKKLIFEEHLNIQISDDPNFKPGTILSKNDLKIFLKNENINIKDISD